MVAMFFSEAGARPWTWEASPSEHKKWVEIEADFAMSSVNPNASDRGYLTLEDFKTAFKQVAPKLSERTVLDVFSKQLHVFLLRVCLAEHSSESFELASTMVCVSVIPWYKKLQCLKMDLVSAMTAHSCEDKETI
ncbi:EF-hand calcium-binding domain-containing protein 11 isoform X7 [Mustela nigripes]|uniref:EF-hand calcium-binding domain-containing protein 11 isoform X7 n=1 Tax=Mustela nigripes TaxID=77151 RepID=UPI002816216D|nr:EF-hand calcium-binding domain-containing protein 11 isoform X7 [Mustela nigripes]